MFRNLLAAALVLCLFSDSAVVHAGNTYFWLSTQGFPSSSPLPNSSTTVPEFYNFEGQNTGSVYIWGRPDAGKTLKNWAINLVSSNPGVLDFDSVQIYNQSETQVSRWQHVSSPTGNTTAINNITGFSLSSAAGQGIGPTTTGLDQYYTSTGPAWLLARVNYSLLPFTTYATTNLSLQVSTFGVSNLGESVSQARVVLGHSIDTVINPSFQSQLNVNIGAHDGVVKYYTNPDANFDDDSDVDGRDFLRWQRGYMSGTTNAQGNTNPGMGPGQDLVVNQFDLIAWQYKYGAPGGVLVAVPEPSLAVLAAWGCAAIVLQREGLRRGNIHYSSTFVTLRGES